jgi:amino acid adenylation domain-containing protein
LFEEQAERTPQARALMAHDGRFTYVELDRRSNQLAHYLQSLEIGPERRVGIALPRSAAMIIAALAVLKAGGAYVPIDPAYPPQRFRQLAEDSRVSVLLTQRVVPEGLNSQSIAIIPLENHWGRVATMPQHVPESSANSSNLAYLIYTSGSSGKPKGVMVSHENVVHSTHARLSYYAQQPERFLLLSPFSFDSSVAGIFWTLLSGGELWLPPEGTQQNVARVAEFVRHAGITHMLALPSLYKSVLLHATQDELKSLRTVIVAGEACPPELVREHFHRLPGASFFNEYGPTEATVWCTVHEAGPSRPAGTVPIGKAIRQTEIHILDSQMRPARPPELGEIYIGGPQLARGYLARPDLTAERFVPDPFAGIPGARLYRTGDLGTLAPDGEIEFLGRIDQQVKIRGYRIELGEIEAAVREHPEVREAVVAGKNDGQGHQRLVAYVVPKAGEVDVAGLRRFLLQVLPEYMTPATFVVLGSLPVNANGKLDRHALPDPGPPESQHAYVAPRNHIEHRLAQIWTELLGVKKVGVHDSFFELGGDSILSLQLAARAGQSGIRLNMAQILAQPTIAGLAANCRSTETAMETAAQS